MTTESATASSRWILEDLGPLLDVSEHCGRQVLASPLHGFWSLVLPTKTATAPSQGAHMFNPASTTYCGH